MQWEGGSLQRAMWPSHSGRHFLRELIVFCFLMPLLDLIADPDTINRLLILLFDPEPSLCFDPLVRRISTLRLHIA